MPDATRPYGIERKPFESFIATRAAGGSPAWLKPVPPPRMLPAESRTTPESSTYCSVRCTSSFWTSPSIEPVHAGSCGLGITRTNDTPGLTRVRGPPFPIVTTISRRAIGAAHGNVNSPPVACLVSAAMPEMRWLADPIRRLSAMTKLQSTLTSRASCFFDVFARITPQLTPVLPNGYGLTDQPV